MTETVIMLFCCIAHAWAADRFCKERLKVTAYKEMAFVSGVFLLWLAADLIACFVPVPYLCLTLACQGALTGLVVLLFEAEWQKRIFAAAAFLTVYTLAANFCGSFLSCLSLVFMHRVRNIREPFLDGGIGSLIDGLNMLLVILILYHLSGHLLSVFEANTGKWYTTAAIPLLIVVVVMDIVNWGASHGILVRSGGNAGVYYDQIFSHVGICVISALSAFGAGFYLYGLDRIYLEQRKSSQYHSQVAAYQMLESQYRQSERLRHDMKNHVIALSGLLKDRDWEKMEDYLETMGQWGSLGMGEETTGNKVVDAVLGQKRQKAENSGILWECDVRVPGADSIDEFDLCVLFGNLVDNALQECERMKQKDHCFIRVQGGLVKKCFLLDIKNSAEAKDKGNLDRYGIGLLNVRDIVHKYNGEIEISAEPDIFAITVLIPLADAGYDIKQTL